MDFKEEEKVGFKTFETMYFDAGGDDQPVVVAVGVGDLSCLPHVVLQVLKIKIIEIPEKSNSF